MEHPNEAQARELEPTLGDAVSPASRRAVVPLARLPPALKEHRLVGYVLWDLGNLVRCALAAGASANNAGPRMTLPCFASPPMKAPHAPLRRC